MFDGRRTLAGLAGNGFCVSGRLELFDSGFDHLRCDLPAAGPAFSTVRSQADWACSRVRPTSGRTGVSCCGFFRKQKPPKYVNRYNRPGSGSRSGPLQRGLAVDSVRKAGGNRYSFRVNR
jgi:hypothetical protein